MNWEMLAAIGQLAAVFVEIIAKRNKPKAFSTYNLRDIVAPRTGS